MQSSNSSFSRITVDRKLESKCQDPNRREFARGLSLFDSAMLVVGAMIGSGIFIVPAEMARHIGSVGWLLVAWGVAGMLTISGALCYGELSAMMPQAGGMYVYLREAYSPLWIPLLAGHYSLSSRRERLPRWPLPSPAFPECYGR